MVLSSFTRTIPSTWVRLYANISTYGYETGKKQRACGTSAKRSVRVEIKIKSVYVFAENARAIGLHHQVVVDGSCCRRRRCRQISKTNWTLLETRSKTRERKVRKSLEKTMGKNAKTRLRRMCGRQSANTV